MQVGIRELSLVHGLLADVLQAQRDLSGAKASYKQSLLIAKRLTEKDPSNLKWLHDLGKLYRGIGDVLQSQGDLANAQTSYEQFSLSSSS